MEDDYKKLAERTIIRTYFATKYANGLAHFAKANPGMGVRVHLRETEDGITKLEFHMRNCTKGQAQTKVIHLVFAYAFLEGKTDGSGN